MSLVVIHPPSVSLDPSPISVPRTLEGPAVSAVEPGRAIVWLIGPIDIAAAAELGEISRSLVTIAPHVVIDPSRLQFFDGTLASFLQDLLSEVAVTIRRPSLLLRQMLDVWRLSELVQIADFPGPAPAVPA